MKALAPLNESLSRLNQNFERSQFANVGFPSQLHVLCFVLYASCFMFYVLCCEMIDND
jgi:hypothetical protein